ncbi:MAG TPA: DnaA/Hda family protein [Burkholderiales bacterium]|nr:DnaA/Hda family protein [Burkholderiales bacterium]
MRQLPLQISAPAEPRFENYVAGANVEALARIRELAARSLPEVIVYLWGEAGSGRTHLLRAAAHVNPELFIADDVEALDPAAQQALFVAINAARDGQSAVLAAGVAAPAQLPLREDLRTRLAWGLVYQLKPLTDAEKALHLRAEAARRGLRLSDEVVWYLLNHLPRDLASLHGVLEVLDRYSLASQRAVTLPLVREALSATQDCANCLDKPGASK